MVRLKMLSPEKLKEDKAMLEHWDSSLGTIYNIIKMVLRELKVQNLNSEFNEEVKKHVFTCLKNAENSIDYGLTELNGYFD